MGKTREDAILEVGLLFGWLAGQLVDWFGWVGFLVEWLVSGWVGG